MNGAHIHLALAHIPVLFSPLALVILLIGLKKNNATISHVALGIFLFSALAALPVYWTGDKAESIIEHKPEFSNAVVETHEEAAEFAFVLSLLAGAWALGSFFLISKKKNFERRALIAMSILGTFSSAALLRTSFLGGKVRHSEIRGETASDPKHPEESYGDEGDDDGDGDESP